MSINIKYINLVVGVLFFLILVVSGRGVVKAVGEGTCSSRRACGTSIIGSSSCPSGYSGRIDTIKVCCWTEYWADSIYYCNAGSTPQECSTYTSGTCKPNPVNGQCGTANGYHYSATELCWGTKSLCQSGSPSISSGSTSCPAVGQTKSWTCNGLYGGYGSSTCYAYRNNPVIGTCGTANNHVFTYADTAYNATYKQCNSGTSSNTTFPSIGGSVSWVCNALDGASPSCTATRPCPVYAAPTNLTPSGAIAPGVRNISWSFAAGANVSYLRIDDTTTPWVGACGVPQNGGDVCLDGLASNVYSYNFVAGHTYNIWVHQALAGCAASGAVGSVVTIANQPPVGSLSASTCGVITGTVSDPDGNNPLSLVVKDSVGNLINGVLSWSGTNFTFNFTPSNTMKDGVDRTISVIATDTKGASTTLGGDVTFVCPVCGPAAKNYEIGDIFPSGNYCKGGNGNSTPVPAVLTSSQPSVWKCLEDKNNASSYFEQCSATMSGNPLVISDSCPACGDGQINFNITAVPDGGLSANYTLEVYRNVCSGILLDSQNSVSPAINWNPVMTQKSIKDIYNSTLCYQVKQGVKILGRETRTYNCPIPKSIIIDPNTVSTKSNTDTTLNTNVLCTDNSTRILIDRDNLAVNEIIWNNGYSTLQTCSPGLVIDYQNTDKYNFHTGQGLNNCSGNISAAINNFIRNGFGWGLLNGSFDTTIEKTVFVVSGDGCPSCGTKYMDVNITVPLMQCS